MYHGTNSESFGSIIRGINLEMSGGCLGSAFYLASDWELAATYAKGQVSGDPVVMAFHVSPSAKILDQRIPEQADRFSQIANESGLWQGGPSSGMVDSGVDGFYDTTAHGVALYNASAVQYRGRINNEGVLVEQCTDKVAALWIASGMGAGEFSLGENSTHGPSHWARVERNALHIAAQTGADPFLVSMFARLHDCQRECESSDEEHGYRAANMVRQSDVLGQYLDRSQIAELADAIETQFEIFFYQYRQRNYSQSHFRRNI